ncbi:MAG: SDR family oxidoreductase [Devosia sp.]
MSRIVVFGGHGRSGQLIVEQLIKKGDEVVATIRKPKDMAAMVKLGAETVLLDLDSSPFDEIGHTLKGADAAVFAAGSGAGEPSAFDRKGTLRTVRAAEKAGVKRYLTISSIGASTGMKLTGAMATEEMRDYYKQKRAANKLLRDSELDWTIIEPGELNDGKPTGKVTLSEQSIDNGKIARADVAAVLIACLADKATIGKTFQLVGGKTPIADAIKNALGRK